MAGLASVLEEACRDSDGDVPSSTPVEAGASNIAAADASGAAARNGTSDKAGSENMDELYEEYRRWKQEQERKRLVADRAARRALEQPSPVPAPEVPLIEEVDLRCIGDDEPCEGSLAGLVFLDDEDDAANAFFIEDFGTGALVEVPAGKLRRFEFEALDHTEAEARVQIGRADEWPEATADMPSADVDSPDSKAMPATDEQRGTMSDAAVQQAEKPDADEIRRKLVEDRKRRRAAATANRKAPEASQTVGDQVDGINADTGNSTELQPEEATEASTVQRESVPDRRDAAPNDAEALREKLLRDRASRKAAERARRKAESENNLEIAPDRHDATVAVISRGRQTILKRSAEQALRFFCDSSCPLAQRVWICLEEKGIAYEYVPTAQAASGIQTASQKIPVFAAASPLGQVPTLEYVRERGLVDCVQDSMACMEYIDEAFGGPPLLPAGNPALRARVRAWCCFANTHIVPLCARLVSASSKGEQEEVLPLLLERLEAFGQAMVPLQAEESSAGTGSYFLGETFSLVDITFFPWWWRLSGLTNNHYQMLAGDAFARLRAWGDACEKRPSVGNTLMTG